MNKAKKGVTFNHNPLLRSELPAWRPRFVLLCLLGGSLALIGRAAYLQGVNDQFLQAKGESRYARLLGVPATRGKITDRQGDVLAVSSPVKSIWAIPEDARLSPAQTRQLASLLELDVNEVNQKLAVDKEFVFLKRQVSPELADRLAALKLPGIHDQREYRRFYPGGEVMAHVLGFTGVDDKGQEGIELAYESALAGKPGSRRVVKDRRGNVVEDVQSIRPPQDGKEVALAIDNKIQYLAHAALKQAITDNKAKAGGVVVLDAKTGEILALANAPTFNPNNRVHLTGEQLRNRALTDTYEPGSTMKPFTAALALENGKFTANTIINCAPGRMTIGTATISDAHPHGALTVAQVIQKSSNIGAAKMALAFQPEVMWKMFDNLGFGTPLKLGFPGEVGGRLRPAKSWRPIEQATMSYGHGISVSLMQMANAYQVFARDGDMVPLSLLRLDAPPLHGTRVFSPQTAREVRQMLEMVVQPGGTAVEANVPGYRVGGKTGTAMKLVGGRYALKYVASFVGIAPISDPRLIVAVMIDEPTAGKHYGGSVAGPVFAQVMGGALRTLGVPADAPLKPLQVARQGSTSAASGESM
ncbi:peptidoglycan D,D-transpeptidase FtsI family protein [Zoogloea sp.]|uniref:peptidoglycan D,D-transpeptidase FtsI family protein n=1 Tax=Zoogloea sp. TaxID=49181 RepID=UPI0035B1555C